MSELADMLREAIAERDSIIAAVDAIAAKARRERAGLNTALHALEDDAEEPVPTLEPAPWPEEVPRVVEPARPRTGRPPSIPYAEVARVANDAVEAGVSGIDAVREHFELKTRTSAEKLIARARNAGHDIADDPPSSNGDAELHNPPLKSHGVVLAPSGRYFECLDPGCSGPTFSTTRELIAHTVGEHHRQPTASERLAVTDSERP